MPSCRGCDGPAAPAGRISLSSDAAPCQRAENATGRQLRQALRLFRALRRHALVPRVRRASGISRPDISSGRCGAMPSCRECDGPAAPTRITSLSSDAAPCPRAECATSQRLPHASHHFRAWLRQAIVQSVRRASSTSRHDISLERHGAMPSCQMGSPAALPSACATGPQRPLAQHLSRARRSLAIAPCFRGANGCRGVEVPYRGAGGRTLAGRYLLTCTGSPVPRGGAGGAVQVRRCRQRPWSLAAVAGLAPGVPAPRAAVGAGEKEPQHLPVLISLTRVAAPYPLSGRSLGLGCRLRVRVVPVASAVPGQQHQQA